MKKIDFTKMAASGNDFCLIDNSAGAFVSGRLRLLARQICDRRRGAGADGLLVLEKSRRADARMRIFNADGSEAEMCGNGARCFALFLSQKKRKSALRFETRAGIIEAAAGRETVRVRLTDPRGFAFDAGINVLGRPLLVNSVNTGVPHAVIFVQGLEKIDVDALGRAIRYHSHYAPAGTNVNFIEINGRDTLSCRTYERGVEGETPACGTGSCAAALVANAKYGVGSGTVKVKTAGGEELKVYFKRRQAGYTDVWLEGKAVLVYTGTYYP